MTDAQKRTAAKAFAKKWNGKGYEKGESQKFWLSLLGDVLGAEHPDELISFEEQVHLDHTSFIDGTIPTTRVLIEKKMENRIWFRQPTEKYMEGLPLGNGRLAAMVLGNPEKNRIALNHEWLWRGENRHREQENMSAHLPQVREKLLNGEYAEGTDLANEYFGGLGGISGKPGRVDPYEPLGDLWVLLEPGEVTDYIRSLDLETGVCTVTFTGASTGKTSLSCFVSMADGALVLTLDTEKPTCHGFALNRQEDERCTLSRRVKDNALIMEGHFRGGIDFAVKAMVKSDGSLSAQDGLSAAAATHTELLLQAGTSAKETSPWDEMIFLKGSTAELLQRHRAAFAQKMGQAQLELTLPEYDEPTDVRIRAYREGKDAGIPLLYFHYGRYLFVSASSGELPLNLQGKWNEDLEPPWQCDYHLDINLQMCYWFAETLGLFEQEDTLFNLAERYMSHGKEVAKALYGCDGVYFCLQTDVWGRMTPESKGWGVWIGAAPWIGTHFYRRWQATGDRDFLKNRAYPFLKEVATFYEDYAITVNGQLTLVPSQSPENTFEGAGDMPVSLCANAAMDVELCRDTLEHAILCAKALDVDADRIARWEEMLKILPRPVIGENGCLLEWDKDYVPKEPGHRHFSPLYGLFPGEMYLPGSSLGKACEKLMDFRLSHGGGHTGWSRSWTACLMARLGRSEEAWEHLTALIADFATISLLDLHPPRIFQIDGNMGGTAAICEMLFHDDDKLLRLLPALPQAWPKGQVKGFRGKWGLTADFAWENGQIAAVTLTSPCDRALTLQMPGEEREITLKANEIFAWNHQI